MKFSKIFFAATLCATAFGASAQVTANMAVSASITGTCGLVANPLAFSVYDPTSATALNAQTTVVLTCTTGAGASLAMGMGANSTVGQRRMRVGATTNYLAYTIYQPASITPGDACAYTAPWGNGTTGGNLLSIGVAPTNASRTYNVCGQILPGINSPVGNYVDTVVVTANL